MELAGKTALITGASQGLGAATARAMAARGARVLLLARTEEKLREVADSIESGGGQAEIFAVDLSDPEALVATTEAIKAAGMIPDVIVNNAGIGRWLFIEETPLDEMQADMALPYFAAFGVTKAFIPRWQAAAAATSATSTGTGRLVSVAELGRLFVGALGVAWILDRAPGRSRGTGVSVTDVVMGRISSNYWKNNPGSEDRMPWVDRIIPTLSEERAAEVVVARRRTRAQTRNGAAVVHGVPPHRPSLPAPRALGRVSGRCPQADIPQSLSRGGRALSARMLEEPLRGRAGAQPGRALGPQPVEDDRPGSASRGPRGGRGRGGRRPSRGGVISSPRSGAGDVVADHARVLRPAQEPAHQPPRSDCGDRPA